MALRIPLWNGAAQVKKQDNAPIACTGSVGFSASRDASKHMQASRKHGRKVLEADSSWDDCGIPPSSGKLRDSSEDDFGILAASRGRDDCGMTAASGTRGGFLSLGHGKCSGAPSR